MPSFSPSDALSQYRSQQAAQFAAGSCDGLVGVSPAIERVRTQLASAAASGANTLIRGREATQISQIARAIHFGRYPAGEQGLLEIDMRASLPSQLGRLLQQLIQADQGGTLSIASADAMSAEQQFELLTAMRHPDWQSQVIATQVLGSENPINDSTTVLSDELLAALSTIVIEVPPLAERIEDIPELANWYLADLVAGTEDPAPALDNDALDMLLIYSWPGEQSEFQQVLTTAAGRSRGGTITPQHLPMLLHHAVDNNALAVERPAPIDLDDYLSRVESALVTRALELANNNKAEAARLLGVSRPRLYRKLEQMGIVEPSASKAKTEQPPADRPTKEPTLPSDKDADDIEFMPLDSE